MTNENPKPQRVRRFWLWNCLLFLASILIGLIFAEILSRWISPVTFNDQFVDMKTGQLVKLYRRGEVRMTPNLTVRHRRAEFDVTMKLTPLGTRGSINALPPRIIFIGDSFTFGWGISDGQSFVDKFCAEARLKCANLGRPNTGTKTQLDILQHYLFTEKWRPRFVYLVFLGMTSYLSTGNDLFDNLKEAFDSEKNKQEKATLKIWEQILVLRRYLYKSNLFRIVYFNFAPLFREKFGIRPSAERLQRALDVTRDQFVRFLSLGIKFGFTPRVVLIHPTQDLTNGTWRETEDAIEEIMGQVSIIKTAEAFLADPTKYYFSWDAHFNPAGASLISDILIQNH